MHDTCPRKLNSGAEVKFFFAPRLIMIFSPQTNFSRRDEMCSKTSSHVIPEPDLFNEVNFVSSLLIKGHLSRVFKNLFTGGVMRSILVGLELGKMSPLMTLGLSTLCVTPILIQVGCWTGLQVSFRFTIHSSNSKVHFHNIS